MLGPVILEDYSQVAEFDRITRLPRSGRRLARDPNGVRGARLPRAAARSRTLAGPSLALTYTKWSGARSGDLISRLGFLR